LISGVSEFTILVELHIFRQRKDFGFIHVMLRPQEMIKSVGSKTNKYITKMNFSLIIHLVAQILYGV